jgi:carbon storage regulator CsrA
MLVLTRKQQQQIQIGEAITVTILSVRGGRVQVGISAPGNVRVMRGELVSSGSAPEVPAPSQVPAAPPRASSLPAEKSLPAAHGAARSDLPGRSEPLSRAADGARAAAGANTLGEPERSRPLAKAVAQRGSAGPLRRPQPLGPASLRWLGRPRVRG